MTAQHSRDDAALPDVLTAATSGDERELLLLLTESSVDAEEIARQLLSSADPDQPD